MNLIVLIWHYPYYSSTMNWSDFRYIVPTSSLCDCLPVFYQVENIPDLPSSCLLLSLSYHGLRPRRWKTSQADISFKLVLCCLPEHEFCRPSSTVNISGLYPFTLADCGLITPSDGFTYFVAAISAPYGYRLTCPSLPVPDSNRLEYASFAWRTHKTFDTTFSFNLFVEKVKR